MLSFKLLKVMSGFFKPRKSIVNLILTLKLANKNVFQKLMNFLFYFLSRI